MMDISWEQLIKNSESEEINFESFNYQIAYKLYSKFGFFEYDYNTPGSEFYLTLYKDCDDLQAKAGDVIGWQAKFWVNHNDTNNTSFDAKHREELVEGLRKSCLYKPNLTTWIICTPGQPSNTEPHKPKDKLIEELSGVRSNLSVIFWNKPVYESIYFKDVDDFASIYSHYFSRKYIGFKFIKDYSEKRIQLLKEKYDIDLYTEGVVDKGIYQTIKIEELFNRSIKILKNIKHKKEEIRRSEYINIKKFIYYSQDVMNSLNQLLEHEFALIKSISETYKKPDINNSELVLESIRQKEHSVKDLLIYINSSLENSNIINTGINYNYKEEECFRYLSEAIHKLREMIEEFSFIQNEILKKNINVFGKAGYGKTSLACSICDTILKEKIPSLLLLASEFNNSMSIKKQILNSLSLEESIDFNIVLGNLNNFGFLKKVKIPIIIDGLNETIPTADIWSHELFYLTKDIKKFEYLILITTCRESYVEQVFKDCVNYNDVENNYYLDGYNESNINVVIGKYFKKYGIKVLNEDYKRELLKNPLLLKMFSKAHEGQDITLTQFNIFNAINTYLQTLIEKVSMQNGKRNKYRMSLLEERIRIFSLALWNSNFRSVKYPSEFVEIFDPKFNESENFDDTFSHKVIDEGLFISRGMQQNEERAGFTYDLLAGFCIAKNVCFDNKSAEQIIEFLTSTDVIDKLYSVQGNQQIHPLAEDIIASIIFLFPQHIIGKQVYEIINNNELNKHIISSIDLFTSTEEGKRSLYNYIGSMKPDNPAIKQLFAGIMTEIINGNRYDKIDLLIETILRMNSVEIDIVWSELLRKNQDTILKYLNNLLRLCESNQVNNEMCNSYLLFTTLILSSTNKLLRDKATKVLVMLGRMFIKKYFIVLKKFEKVSDLYIVERLIAALLGIALNSSNKEIILEIANYLEINYILKTGTTHLLIMDYIDTILDYAVFKYNYKRVSNEIDSSKLSNWESDPDCIKDVKSVQDASWGYGPIHMDFAKNIIGHISKDYHSPKESKPNLIECLAMVIWKIKEYGYSEKLFGTLDKEIMKVDKRYEFGEAMVTERYAKKYSWIAYFELYGYLIIKKIVKSDYENSMRVNSVNIDPTFPVKPPLKEQLVVECFLPAYNEDIQNWIVQDKTNYLEKVYTINSPDNEWILVNACLKQKSDENIRIDILVSALLIEENSLSMIENIKESNYFEINALENYYLFAGEIPWSKNINNYQQEFLDHKSKKINVYHTYSWYSWESYHSSMNDMGNMPFVASEIAQYLSLTFNTNDFSYYTQEGQLATKYIWDNYSHYLFIRKDLLKRYCAHYKLELVWYESGTRYGDFGNRKTILGPSLKDFKNIKAFKL